MRPHSFLDQPAIEVCGLNVRYPEVHALKDVNISIASGSFVLIGGPSGSGKSTLAHALMGLISHETDSIPVKVTGRVSVAGLDPQRHSVARLASQAGLGLVFQNPATQLFNGTVEEEAAFGPRNLALPAEEISARVQYGLQAAGCVHLRGRAVRHLSGGEQQRVAIAASLAMRPVILILDEPTANLDSEGARSIVQTLAQLHRRSQVTVVVIEHQLEPFLPYAGRMIWLDEGRVVADGPFAETLAQMWHSPLSRSPSPPQKLGEESIDKPLVTLDKVTAGYEKRPILQDCSLTVRQGEFAALVGPNGAGKSTLARVLAGLARPRRGRVAWHAHGGTRPRSVGFLQQNPLHQLVCDTVEEDIRFGPRNLGTERTKDVETMLAQTDLLTLRHRPTRALSVGQQQRAALAATLILRPALLILDEPTIGQDRQHLSQMMNSLGDLNRAGQTILLITHNQLLVKQYATRVWSLQEGQAREQKAAPSC